MNHIAYLTTEYPHPALPSAGGVGSFVKLMATSLIEKNWKVTVFLALRSEYKVWYDGQVRIVEIKKANPSYLSAFKDRLKISKIINKHIKEDDINIIEAPDWEGFHAFCNIKIPLITRIHGSVTYFNYLQKLSQSKLLAFFEKRALSKSKHVIAVSKFSGKLTQEVFKFKSFSFDVIYNGVDTRKFEKQPLEKDSKVTILYFGTLVRKKGVLELASIFNELVVINPTSKLILVGKDTYDDNTKMNTWQLFKKKLSNKASKRVSYQGVVSYEDMNLIIQEADVCVFPSFAEAFPISWLEAMSMSKPVVASSIGWAKEAMENGVSGFLVHPKKHKAYASKINELLVNPELAKNLGKNARQRVEDKFGQEIIIKQNITIYKKLIGHE